MEQWKDIPEYENEYQASNRGRVRSKDREVGTGMRHSETKLHKGKVLKLNLKRDGYWKVCLSKDNVVKTHAVHRLVAYAFLDKPEGKDYVNHKNLNKSDNRVDNLEWVTSSENQKHAISNGAYIPIGIKNRKRIRLVEKNMIFESSYAAAEWLNINEYYGSKDVPCMGRRIRGAATKRSKTAYGYTWEDVCE